MSHYCFSITVIRYTGRGPECTTKKQHMTDCAEIRVTSISGETDIRHQQDKSLTDREYETTKRVCLLI